MKFMELKLWRDHEMISKMGVPLEGRLDYNLIPMILELGGPPDRVTLEIIDTEKPKKVQFTHYGGKYTP